MPPGSWRSAGKAGVTPALSRSGKRLSRVDEPEDLLRLHGLPFEREDTGPPDGSLFPHPIGERATDFVLPGRSAFARK